MHVARDVATGGFTVAVDAAVPLPKSNNTTTTYVRITYCNNVTWATSSNLLSGPVNMWLEGKMQKREKIADHYAHSTGLTPIRYPGGQSNELGLAPMRMAIKYCIPYMYISV